MKKYPIFIIIILGLAVPSAFAYVPVLLNNGSIVPDGDSINGNNFTMNELLLNDNLTSTGNISNFAGSLLIGTTTSNLLLNNTLSLAGANNIDIGFYSDLGYGNDKESSRIYGGYYPDTSSWGNGFLRFATHAGGSFALSDTMTITKNMVAIGTTTPQATLDVYGATNSTTLIESGSTAGLTSLQFSPGQQSLGYIYDFGSTYTTSGRYVQGSMLLENGGTGGIGIAATQASAPISFYAGGTTEDMRIDSTGNVGIGTTSPATKLDVAGFINTDQYSGYKQNGVAVLIASSSNSSLSVGQYAGTAFKADGSQNTAVGWAALWVATSSDWNTAVGANSLTTNNSGNANSGLGMDTLRLNTTGSFNAAFGFQAMYNNTIGNYNTGIGTSALISNTTGSNNMALGLQAMQKNTTGGLNTAIGVNALSYNTTGSFNTAIGDAAGMGALADNRSVIDAYVTLLGYNASRDNSIASTSSLTNITAIGKNSMVACSNCMTLGGTGADAVKVGIGTSTPLARLTIYDSTSGLLPTLRLENGGSFAGAEPTIDFVNSAGGLVHARISSKPGTAFGASQLTFSVADSSKVIQQRAIIDVNGNLGIATSTPSQKLDVNGSINIEGNNGIIMKDTVTGSCYLVQITSGVLVPTAHVCQ